MKNWMMIAIVPILLGSVIPVYADGWTIGEEDKPVYEPSQRALIKKHRGTETIILQVKVASSLDKIGWVIPIPSYPEVTEADPELFNELTKLTEPPDISRFTITQLSENIDSYLSEPYVSVETSDVGIYKVNRIRSNSADQLFKWLSDNKFALPEDARYLLNVYIHKDFSFLAIRVDMQRLSDSKQHDILNLHWLDPLRIEFKSKKYFFPMRISSLNPGSTQLTLWALAPTVLEFTSAHVVWNNLVSRRSLMKKKYPLLAAEVRGTQCLTRLSREWESNKEIKADIFLEPTPGVSYLYQNASESQKANFRGMLSALLLILAIRYAPTLLRIIVGRVIFQK